MPRVVPVQHRGYIPVQLDDMLKVISVSLVVNNSKSLSVKEVRGLLLSVLLVEDDMGQIVGDDLAEDFLVYFEIHLLMLTHC